MITLLFALLVHTTQAADPDYSVAMDKLGSALYVQTGLDQYVMNMGRYYDTKYVPDFVNDKGIIAAVIYQCLEKHQISYTWRF